MWDMKLSANTETKQNHEPTTSYNETITAPQSRSPFQLYSTRSCPMLKELNQQISNSVTRTKSNIHPSLNRTCRQGMASTIPPPFPTKQHPDLTHTQKLRIKPQTQQADGDGGGPPNHNR